MGSSSSLAAATIAGAAIAAPCAAILHDLLGDPLLLIERRQLAHQRALSLEARRCDEGCQAGPREGHDGG
eukprot:3700599-Pyramimonas_sp.AAC.1